MKSLLLALVALFALLPALPAQTQAEMNAEAAADLTAADIRLNRAYQSLLKQHAGESQYLADLREAQRAWLKYVDYHLKTLFPLEEGEDPRQVYGSMYSLDYAVAKTPLVQARAQQLEEMKE